MFNLFPDAVGHFGLSGRLGVAGGAAFQAVSECLLRRQAGILLFFSVSPPSFLRRDLFSQRECSNQKPYLVQVDGIAQKPKTTHLSGPIAAILDFEGNAALKAVSECPQCRQAGIPTQTHPRQIKPFEYDQILLNASNPYHSLLSDLIFSA